MVNIISRAAWGFSGWRSQPRSRRLSDWHYFVIHYEGANPCGHQTGPAVPRGIHRFHKDGRGWAGIGYNFVVDQAGNVFEGRGWNLAGAHKPSGPGSNNVGIGVQCHIGGAEQPSAAMQKAVSDLYVEACRRTGRSLIRTWHGDGYATSCPGRPLIQWVKAGMPVARPHSTFPASGKTGPGMSVAIPKQATLKATGYFDRATVKALQELSNAERIKASQRISVRYWPDLVVDGLWGPQTRKGLQALAGLKGADVDGIIGPVSIKAIGA